MGRHPYVGRFRGIGDMPVERAIAEFRYAFGNTAAQLQMAGPLNTLPVEEMAPSLAPLFEQAFLRESEKASTRARARQWHAALDSLLGPPEKVFARRGARLPVRACVMPLVQGRQERRTELLPMRDGLQFSQGTLSVSPSAAAIGQEIESFAPPALSVIN